MFLAMANVLFKENLYDQAFVSKYVEPTGFAKWKDYVLGNTAGPDGKIDRTPEWAEKISECTRHDPWALARSRRHRDQTTPLGHVLVRWKETQW